jgi:hypothetical protein
MSILIPVVAGDANATAPANGYKVQNTNLATLDARGIPVGTTIWDTTGTAWTLEQSTSTVDHTTVEAVAGCPTLRWKTGGGGGGTVATVVAGAGISVDSSDPANPIVKTDPGTLFTVTGSAVQLYEITGLTGDTDGDYEVEINWTGDTNGDTLRLQFNGADPSASKGGYIINQGGAVFASATLTNTMLIGTITAGLTCDIRLRIASKSGRNRLISGLWVPDAGQDAVVAYTNKDTGVAITKLSFLCSRAAGIKVGTAFRIRKLGFTA